MRKERVDCAQHKDLRPGHAGSAAALQPRALSRGDPHSHLRGPRRPAHLHVARGAVKSHDADVHTAADAPDERVQQEVGQPPRGLGAPLRLLQFLPRPQHDQGDSGDGGGVDDAAMGFGRANGGLTKRSFSWNSNPSCLISDPYPERMVFTANHVCT